MEPGKLIQEERLVGFISQEVQQEVNAQVRALKIDLARGMVNTLVNAHELGRIIGMSPASVLRKRKMGELPYELKQGRYYFDLRVIAERAHECNFHNTGRVREAIEDWIDGKINEAI